VRIRALVPRGVVPVVCEPVEAKRRPVSDYDAKFSIPYAVASGLLRGHLDLSDLDRASLEDASARAIMDLVDYEEDPASTYPRHYTGEVIVELDDGTSLSERVDVNRGHAERPLTNAEIETKFFANCERGATPAQAQLVRDAVLSLEDASDMRAFETLLTLQ
jgi:2-methylcitrate dehydratase PrpD